MMLDDLAPLRAEVLWLAVRKTAVNGRSCREYDITDERGVILLSARAYTWSREILVSGEDGSVSFAIVRSRAFPLTGRAAVRLAASSSPLGTVARNGVFRDASGVARGRFVDARSFRERAGESLFQGIMEALLAGDGESVSSGPDGYVLQVGGAVAGTLTYGVLPFTRSHEERAPAPSRLRDRIVPRALRGALQSLNAPRGWKFVRSRAGEADPRLQMAAAIFAAELSRW